MQSHVGPAISSAVRTATSRGGDGDTSARLVGTGIALGLVALAAHVFGRSADTAGTRSRRR